MNVSVATNPPASIAGNRRSAQRAATRARLFDETVKEFKARGFAETEIGVITERVGVSRGAFYVHFAGKDEVLRKLLLIEEGRIAAAAQAVSDRGVPLEAVFGAVIDAVLAAERRLGRRLVRDLCAAQFRPDFAQIQDVGDHPLGVMLVGAIAERSPEVDPVDLAMTFLTGMFGLLATDDASTAHRRRRLDLLVRLTSTETSGR
ncbi:MAG: TetR/AcrR family transcriptional regulator [Microthrixaceae bacterium]|jgi:AcrR family transcriptional regulator